MDIVFWTGIMSVGENYCSFNRDNWFQERKYVCRTAFLSVRQGYCLLDRDIVCKTLTMFVTQ